MNKRYIFLAVMFMLGLCVMNWFVATTPDTSHPYFSMWVSGWCGAYAFATVLRLFE